MRIHKGVGVQNGSFGRLFMLCVSLTACTLNDPPDDGALLVYLEVLDDPSGELEGAATLTFPAGRIDVVHRSDPADPSTERVITIDQQQREFDISLTKGFDELVAILPIAPGGVFQIRFITSGPPRVLVAGTPHAVKLPSGEQTGLKLVPSGQEFFQVRPKEATLVQGQFDPNRNMNGNRGVGFMLKPTLQTVELVQNREQRTGTVPGRLLVKFAPGTTQAVIDSVFTSIGATVFQEGALLFFQIDLPATLTIPQAMEHLARVPEVLFALPDVYIIDRQVPPGDPGWAEGQNSAYGVVGSQTSVRGTNTWMLTQGDRNIVVAVVERGFDIDHPDLIDNIYLNEGELPANFRAIMGGRKAADCNEDGLITFGDLRCNGCSVTSPGNNARDTCRASFDALRAAACTANSRECIPAGMDPIPSVLIASLIDGDSDGNGFPDDLIGWDFTTRGGFGKKGDNDPTINRTHTDDGFALDHGTFMAGIIGAVPNNALDVVGTAWNVRLMLLASDTAGQSRNAFFYATGFWGAQIGVPVNVINFSRGAVVLTEEAPALGGPVDRKCPVTYQKVKQSDIDSKAAKFDADLRSLDLSKTLLVTAVSNCPIDVDLPGVYEWPAELASSSVVAVTTSGPGTAFGATTVDIVGLAGPGVGLKNRANEPPKTRESAEQGTSAATAYTSGVAALVLSVFPDLVDRPDCLRSLLMRNGQNPDGVVISKRFAGTGRLDMFDAVRNQTTSPTPMGCPR